MVERAEVTKTWIQFIAILSIKIGRVLEKEKKRRKKKKITEMEVWRNEMVERDERERPCGKGTASGARRDLHPVWKRMRPGIQVQIISRHCAREFETVVMTKSFLQLPSTSKEPDWSTPYSEKSLDTVFCRWFFAENDNSCRFSTIHMLVHTETNR